MPVVWLDGARADRTLPEVRNPARPRSWRTSRIDTVGGPHHSRQLRRPHRVPGLGRLVGWVRPRYGPDDARAPSRCGGERRPRERRILVRGGAAPSSSIIQPRPDRCGGRDPGSGRHRGSVVRVQAGRDDRPSRTRDHLRRNDTFGGPEPDVRVSRTSEPDAVGHTHAVGTHAVGVGNARHQRRHPEAEPDECGGRTDLDRPGVRRERGCVGISGLPRRRVHVLAAVRRSDDVAHGGQRVSAHRMPGGPGRTESRVRRQPGQHLVAVGSGRRRHLGLVPRNRDRSR